MKYKREHSMSYMHSGRALYHNRPFDVCVCELEGGGVFDRPPTSTGQAASLAVLPTRCETAVCGSRGSFCPLRKGTPAAKILQTAARVLTRALIKLSLSLHQFSDISI